MPPTYGQRRCASPALPGLLRHGRGPSRPPQVQLAVVAGPPSNFIARGPGRRNFQRRFSASPARTAMLRPPMELGVPPHRPLQGASTPNSVGISDLRLPPSLPDAPVPASPAAKSYHRPRPASPTMAKLYFVFRFATGCTSSSTTPPVFKVAL